MAQAAAGIRGGVHIDSLGAPVKRLLAKLRGSVSEEDLKLLSEFVSVKDMARIFDSLNSDRSAESIWEELRAALLARKEKQLAKNREMNEREAALNAMKDETAADEEEEERLRKEAEARKAKKAEKKARKEAEAAAAAEEEERLRLEAEAAEAERLEAERLAEEEAAEKARKAKKEEKKRKLKEEEERLAKARADEAAKSKRDQRKEWEDFVASHPLEYSDSAGQEIQQKSRAENNEDGLAPKPTLAASADLLNRTWTPYCPHCHAKYSKPPPEWDCSMCLRKFRQHVKCWQPDDKANNCAVCKRGIGRFTRHHCRNCGRCVCGPCSDYNAKITSVGYNSPVRVCRQCVDELGTVQQAGQ
jgi:hypothetical protein